MSKRLRSDLWAESVSATLVRAEVVTEGLKNAYGSMSKSTLWDTSKIQILVQPTMYHSDDTAKEYRYIGRAKAEDLLSLLEKLEGGARLRIQGAKGSGKTTVVSSLAGYMLGNLKREVVYICASCFIDANVDVLQHALLVASGDKKLASFTEMDELHGWCKGHTGPLLFVVDEWDSFESRPAAEQALMAAVSGHILVQLSSTSSQEQRTFLAGDTFEFDGPYTREELETWIAQSRLSEAKLEALDFLTGGMPRLLRFYEESGGKGRLRIHWPYTDKLFYNLIGLQKTREQLASAVQMVTMGVPGDSMVKPIDMTCFYRDGSFRILSPYLRSRAEYYIILQEQVLQSGLDDAAIRTWASAVRMDCVRRGRNPAQAGWNVEGLVIAVMRYQKKLWDGLPFELCKTYEPGGQAALLGMLSNDELRYGVLAVPIELNDREVDLVYVKLDENILTIKAVQITISKWKNKRRKGSHKVWQEQILPRWLAEGWKAIHQFIYVMPETLTLQDLETVNTDLSSYIAACRVHNQQAGHAAEGDDSNEEDEEDDTAWFYGRKEYETVDFDAVPSQVVAFKRFQDVHHSLREIDKLLDLNDEPPKLKKGAVRQCVGMVGPRQCSNWCRMDAPIYFCCDAHKPAPTYISR